jgi:uncharacterized protein (DUF1684 family)
MRTVLPFFLIGSLLSAANVDNAYRTGIDNWRQRREASLKADGGWLTVTGLFWLKQGENTVGSDASNDILLPESAPAHFGAVVWGANGLSFRASDPGVQLNGKPVREAELQIGGGKQDILSSGPIQLLPLKRGDRFALRLKDGGSKLRTGFTGLKWHPVREDWRIAAKFTAYPSPTKLTFETIIGETETMESPGFVTFERGGETYKLLAVGQGKRLFFVLRDRTSGKTTYGSRFLYADAPAADGTVILDFNKAENPPCAFTPYATCPLPPAQNRLSLAITAGELKYESGAAH